eukprot:SAG31_NODE_43196_length_268_cov_0.609467_1_plen_65_part_01
MLIGGSRTDCFLQLFVKHGVIASKPALPLQRRSELVLFPGLQPKHRRWCRPWSQLCLTTSTAHLH